MAHSLRLKLHALCSTRLSSPALAAKLLKSPDLRLTSWRWYGEGALLEDHGIPSSENDGYNLKIFADESKDAFGSDSLGASKLLKPRDRSSLYRNQQRNKDTSSLSSRSEDYSYTRASEESIFEDGDHLVSENAAQKMKLHKGSDDSFMSGRGRFSSISRESTHQASSNSDGASKQANMVCVQYLPSTSNPSMVKAAMAVHGEVVGFFKKPVRDRLCVYIQFKTAEGMESALAARKLQLGSKTCYIVRAEHAIFTTVVRLNKVSNDTDVGQLQSVCQRYGKVDDVRKRAHGVFDVFYDPKELTNISSILTRLNVENANRSTWFALPAPVLHPSVQKEAMRSHEGQSWHEIQVNQAINRIDAGLNAVSVLFEDLKQLNSVAREYAK